MNPGSPRLQHSRPHQLLSTSQSGSLRSSSRPRTSSALSALTVPAATSSGGRRSCQGRARLHENLKPPLLGFPMYLPPAQSLQAQEHSSQYSPNQQTPCPQPTSFDTHPLPACRHVSQLHKPLSCSPTILQLPDPKASGLSKVTWTGSPSPNPLRRAASPAVRGSPSGKPENQELEAHRALPPPQGPQISPIHSYQQTEHPTVSMPTSPGGTEATHPWLSRPGP